MKNLFKRLLALVLMISSISVLTGCNKEEKVADVDGNHYIFVDAIYEYKDNVHKYDINMYERSKYKHLFNYVNDTIFFKGVSMYYTFGGELYEFNYLQKEDDIKIYESPLSGDKISEIKTFVADYHDDIPYYCYLEETVEIEGDKILVNFTCNHEDIESVTKVYRKYA